MTVFHTFLGERLKEDANIDISLKNFSSYIIHFDHYFFILCSIILKRRIR